MQTVFKRNSLIVKAIRAVDMSIVSKITEQKSTSFPGSLFFRPPVARERETLSLSLATGGGKKRDPGNEVEQQSR